MTEGANDDLHMRSERMYRGNVESIMDHATNLYRAARCFWPFLNYSNADREVFRNVMRRGDLAMRAVDRIVWW